MSEAKTDNASLNEENAIEVNHILELRKFGIAFGSNVIFENLDYEFTSGIYAFSGTSGVGKTTLMRCIAGLENQYTGEIFLDGKLLKGTTPDIHMVHPHYTSYPWLNVVKNVLMVHKGHKVKVTHEHIAEAREVLTRFGLGEHLHKIPSQISGGQDQRLSLCSAFVNPWSKVFLYDEPSSALDASNTSILVELIKEHQAKYNTIEIVITHDSKLLEELKPQIIYFTPEFRLRPDEENICERTEESEEQVKAADY